MGDYSESITVTVDPDRVYAFLSDVANLPRYFDRMTSAEVTGPEEVHTTAVVDGETAEGEAWFRVDGGARTIEWGSESESDYSGRLEVVEDAAGSVVLLTLHTAHVEDERIADSLQESLDRVKELLEA